MSSKIIPAGELQGQALPTLQFASFGQITPNSRLARVAAAVTPKVTLPASVDLGALLAAAGVDDPTAFVELDAAFRATMAQGGSAERLVQTFTQHNTHSYLSDPTYPTLMTALLRGELG